MFKELVFGVPSMPPGTWRKTFKLSLNLAARLSTEHLIWGDVQMADLRSNHPHEPVESLRSFEIGSNIELSAEVGELKSSQSGTEWADSPRRGRRTTSPT